ncbi:S-DNA-T family DNA segregation ATPase FtsK/SpoIIIE [Saccharopolyspora gloriosae]|uniref:S-DNA-T family DNA segregation ATPase FtsK/SpoIIIE n=1 Tax=Saccharopolyspora gloriosae TaxID=455344 RepID=A0A840NDU5_9PSEU|nr:cell division protein FtsK [Saccharopolyspora gloriosae]MBB5067392.1 S-DNA-T family DNA segregation ATPase FtsK/SpoIIIE [Saccharopolyspora gloriosae]
MAEFGTMPTAATLACLGAAGLSWYRGHPDSFDQHAAPALRSFRRRWLRYVAGRWRNLMIDCEFSRENRRTGHVEVPRLVRVRSASPSIDTLYVKPLRGQSLKKFTDATEELAMALKADGLGIVKVKPQLIAITVVRGNPFSELIAPASIPEDSADVDLSAIFMGEDEYGNDWFEPLKGGHLLGVGATGSGKRSLLWNPLLAMGPAIRDGLVLPEMCDLKGGMEAGDAQPLFHRYAAEPADALELIEGYRDDMKATQAHLSAAGMREITVSRETPFRPLFIDELAMMTALADSSTTRQAVRLLAEVMTQGRAAGFAVCAYLQEPTKDVLPIRDLFTGRICLRTTAANHPDMVLGEDMRLRGALADEIPADAEHAGIGFRVDQRSRRPIRVRAGCVSDGDIAELVRSCTPTAVDDSNVVRFRPDDDADDSEEFDAA